MPVAIPGLIGFLLTTFCLQWWQRSAYPLELWLGLLALFTLFFSVTFVTPVFKRLASLTGALILGIAVAFLAVSRTVHVPTPGTIDFHANDQEVTLYGRIVRSPDRRPLRSHYVLDARTLTWSGATQPVSGLVRVTDSADYPRFAYGDWLIVEGNLERPEPIQDFRYDLYLARENIYAVMPFGRIQATLPTRSTHPIALLDRLRDRFEARINRLFPEPHASLLAGLLTGSRRGMPDDLTDAFAETGLTHLVAISGSNVTMVLIVIGALLFWLPLRFRLIPSALAIIGFALFTGAGAPVLRAAIMGVLGLLAVHTGRVAHVRLMTLWSATLLLAWRPQLLWWDASFQLSFLALMGLIELTPIITPLLKRVPETFGLRESLTATLAAQIITAPWIALLFGRFSVIAPLANLLVAPLIAPIMLLGTIATVVGTLSESLGTLISFPCYLLLDWMVGVAYVLSRMPGASVPLPLERTGVIIAYTALIIALLLWHRARPRTLSMGTRVV